MKKILICVVLILAGGSVNQFAVPYIKDWLSIKSIPVEQTKGNQEDRISNETVNNYILTFGGLTGLDEAYVATPGVRHFVRLSENVEDKVSLIIISSDSTKLVPADGFRGSVEVQVVSMEEVEPRVSGHLSP